MKISFFAIFFVLVSMTHFASCNIRDAEARRTFPIILLKESSGEIEECKSELERFIATYEGTSQEAPAREELGFIEEIETRQLKGKEKFINDVLNAVNEHNISLSEKAKQIKKETNEIQPPEKIDTAGLKSRIDEEIEALWLVAKKIHLSYRAYYRANSHYIQDPYHLGLKYDKKRYKITIIPFKRTENGYQGYNAEVIDRKSGVFININNKSESRLITKAQDYINYLMKSGK